MKLFVLLVCLVTMAGSISKADDLNCNSDAAKRILLDNTILKAKRNLIETLAQAGPNASFGGTGPSASDLASAFQNFSADVVNVRQQAVTRPAYIVRLTLSSIISQISLRW
jgi:hypothetical protein